MLDQIKAFFDGFAHPHDQAEHANGEYSLDEKIALVEHLWQVAYADQTLCRCEEHLVRKLAQLLYIPHSQFVAARLRAAETVKSGAVS